jgi:hypothetical protein
VHICYNESNNKELINMDAKEILADFEEDYLRGD